jgi:integrase
MASLQERNGSYRVLFCHQGKLHTFTLGKVGRDEADHKIGQVDYLLMRLKQGLLILPDGTDLVTFVQHDGKPPHCGPTLPEAPRRPVTLQLLKERYLATHGNGTIEANSLATCRLHLNHFCTAWGDSFPLGEVSHARLQDYINKRIKARVSPVTIRKEIGTLRAAWNWGQMMDLTNGAFPAKGLRYPKGDEKPPFRSLAETRRLLAAGGDPEQLGESLYLQEDEIARLLNYIRSNAAYAWLYPLCVFAAHTGARRSELLRAKVTDIDFDNDTLLVHEKKRSRQQRTHRRVPLTKLLRKELRDWLDEHPGGPFLFCHNPVVARSKKRSRTTGHKSGKERPSTLKGRLAGVAERRARLAPMPLTRNEVHDHFKRTLAGSPWEVVRGLHVLRHSFISACASKGVGQRFIDEWVGHQTDQQRQRYRHLYPSTQREAIRSVFD